MRFLYLGFLILALSHRIIYGQCSDAGFCSIGTLRANEEKDTLYSNFILSQFIALGEQKTLHLTFYPESNFKLLSGTALQIKIPYTFIFGNLATTTGIGDLFISITQSLFKSEISAFRVTFGTKIPLTQPNKIKDDKPLPMVYQTTLGTNDLMAGISYFYQKWVFSAGYQHSFNFSSNSFLHSVWSDNQAAQDYFESNQLKRSDDVMLRIEKRFQLAHNKKLFVGLLPIYYLQKDVIKDSTGVTVNVPRSDGFTINLSFSLLIPLKNNYLLKFSTGNPLFLTRKVRPDGLTRGFNLGIHLERKF